MSVITLFQGLAAANSAPTLITDGVPLRKGGKKFLPLRDGEGFNEDLDEAAICLYETAYTSGVPAIAFARIFGMIMIDATTHKWIPLGVGTGAAAAATDKGRLNNGAAIDGPTATTIRHTERLRGLREFERIALQVGTYTGEFELEAQLRAVVVR